METYYTRKETLSKLKIHYQTLRNWRISGKIQYKQIGKRYLYNVKGLMDEPDIKVKHKICYCRVSTYSQKKELDNQITYMKSKYPDYEILTDIGSGLNFKRKNFIKILEYGISNELEELVVAYKDRLCRISYELIEYLLVNHSNTKITILDDEIKSPEKEVTDDLIQIITVFSSRLYGMRSYDKSGKKVKKSKKE